jgi:sugar (pentulose or hexulose) kinase
MTFVTLLCILYSKYQASACNPGGAWRVELHALRRSNLSTRILGIDCGTSYIKSTSYDPNTGSLKTTSIKSPSCFSHPIMEQGYAPNEWWDAVSNVLQALRHHSAEADFVALCTSGISPVLVIFDQANEADALGLPYWYLHTIDMERSGAARTHRRLKMLQRVLKATSYSRPAVTDLIGYLNYRLTGTLTINAVALAELGLGSHEAAFEALDKTNAKLPTIGAASWHCGAVSHAAAGATSLPVGSQVCYGAPDSFAFALSGPHTPQTTKIYLGTFGSLLLIRDDLDHYSTRDQFDYLPYEWLLSVPRFGTTIESLARTFFPGVTTPEALNAMDSAALRAPAGAEGVFLALPFWDRLGREHGSYGFHNNGKRPINRGLLCRSALESLAYILQSRGIPKAPSDPNSIIHVGGGGAKSSAWVSIIAATLEHKLAIHGNLQDAVGACLLALKSMQIETSNARCGGELSVFAPKELSSEAIASTRAEAAAWYSSVPVSEDVIHDSPSTA